MQWSSARAHMRELVLTAGPALLLMVGAFWVAARFIEPSPPQTMTVAAASKGSPYHRLAEQYRTVLARSGVTLAIRETGGSIENLRLLGDDTSGVQLGFLQGGLANALDAPRLRSLGRLFHEPLWVFYRGEAPIDRLSALAGKRILVGPAGGGTNRLALKVLAASGVTAATATLINMELPDYVAAFESGNADAGFLVLMPEAATVTRLLASPAVRLLSLAQADAYAQRFPFLSRLDLKRGVVDFARDVPPTDTALLATTAACVVRDDLHPALANLMTQAIVEVHGKPDLDAKGENGLFARAGFPLAADPEFPLADEARRVYRSGAPFLQRYLPFWLATLTDRLVVLLVPFLGLAVPLVRFLPQLYTWRIRRRFVRQYGALKKVEAGLDTGAAGGEQLRHAFAEIDRIEAAVNGIPVPLGFSNQLYDLREHIDVVRRRLAARQAAVQPAPAMQAAPTA
jgi:uncharacterized protein